MGHKVNPNGFRLGIIRDWQSKWYGSKKQYLDYLHEDLKLRSTIMKRYPDAGISQVDIDRQSNRIAVTVHTSRPGIVIGRGGQRVDEMRQYLENMVKKKIQLNIQEIQQPELDAFLVARNVADQIEHHLAYRRAMKQAIFRTLQAGAKGMRITCSGRLGGAEIARSLMMHEGRVPLQTLRADVDYGFTEAATTMGRIGIKVCIYKGDILPEAESEIITVESAGTQTTEPGVEQSKPVTAETEGKNGAA
jgi:small subunit ribosomal protein S3